MPVSKAAQHQPLSGPGVSYNLRFVGSIDVRISMKTLEFSTRTALVKECICLVCEQAGYISSRSKHHIDGRVKNLLGPKPTVTLAGNNVDLVINTQSLTVLNADEDVGSLIFSHLMPNVSFASGGEEQTSEFICYVAKDAQMDRKCYVFECGSLLAAEVLETIGRAFTERLAEIKRKAEETLPTIPEAASSHSLDRPPPSPQLMQFEPVNTPPGPANDYVNDSVISAHNDPIGFSPLSLRPPTNEEILSKEIWYHGSIQRPQAEALMRKDGDFLVRKSTHDHNQFILTGMQSGSARHLMLMDAEGKVRTKDREFNDVSHLIQYHRDHNLPITSAESALLLKTPVMRTQL